MVGAAADTAAQRRSQSPGGDHDVASNGYEAGAAVPDSNGEPVGTCHNCGGSEGDDPVVAEAFMTAAAASAKAGVKLQHGGPFGACVVKGGIVIACAHNSVLLDGDPTCHAEMNAVRQACAALQSHDLSDCELYTTCEPCPMCWGAVQWSRLNKVYIGADRFTAAKYGFDDKVFYDEVEHHATTFGLHRYGFLHDSNIESSAGTLQRQLSEERVHKNMIEVHTGISRAEAEALFKGSTNRNRLRRLDSGSGVFRKIYEDALGSRPSSGTTVGGMQKPEKMPAIPVQEETDPRHEAFMRRAIDVARRAAKQGTSKQREPFGAVVVSDGKVIATGTNSTLHTRDATATAEVNAIRAAAQCLGTYNLENCTLYTTTVPDVMSMSACLWARLQAVYCGVTQEFALRHGHEDGWLHFEEFMMHGEGQRSIPTTQNVARPICEDVFKFWSSLNGTIY